MTYQPHYHFVAFLVSAVVVLICTPLIREVGIRSGYVDQPGERKVHQRPMVRLGGVGIFLGTTLALLTVWGSGGFGTLPPEQSDEVWGVTIGGLACFVIGLTDDLFNISPFTRLVMQSIVSIGAWQMGVQIKVLSIPLVGIFPLPMWISLPLTMLWLIGMINAINWIDGLDGLAAGVSGIAAVIMLMVCLFVNQPAAGLIVAALAGGALGFLRYNFNPAQIFMGDGGAYFIGFILAGAGVIGLVKGVTTVAVVLPYLILAVPLLDMSAVIIDRLRRGKSPFNADKRHLHHRLLRAGLSHRLTVIVIYGLTLWVGTIALALSGMPDGIGYAISATVLLVVIVWRAVKQIQKQHNDSA